MYFHGFELWFRKHCVPRKRAIKNKLSGKINGRIESEKNNRNFRYFVPCFEEFGHVRSKNIAHQNRIQPHIRVCQFINKLSLT